LDQLSEIIITVWADLERAPLGQVSKLLAPLAGTTVLRRTAERISRVRNVKARVVYCPQGQRDRIASLVSDLPIDVVDVDCQLPQRWPSVQATRKWAKTCWRGGLMGGCCFDEDLVGEMLYGLAKHYSASAILSVPSHAVVVDPELLEQQIDRYNAHKDEFKIGFTQAPPGLTGVIVETELLNQLARTGQLAGSALVYRPSTPKLDIITKPCNLPLDPSIVHTSARLICDTVRSFNTIEHLLNDVPERDRTARKIVDWFAAAAADRSAPWPDEIEIELVSGWPTPTSYRPTPEPPRGPIDADRLLDRLSEVTAQCDDLLIWLGGFGEPTRHPQFGKIVTGLNEIGVWGIGLATTGVLDEKTARSLLDLPIDVVTVLLDVPDRELYHQIMGADSYEQVVAVIEQLLHMRQENRQPLPIVVPEMIKTHQTTELMDAFYDAWLRRAGAAVIRGYSDYAGQLADLAVSSMAPPDRRPCRRLCSRLTILADGTVPICDQDFQGRLSVGSIATDSLLKLWQTGPIDQLREAQLEAQYDTNELCLACRQWHRP